jgi:hypothetical protein
MWDFHKERLAIEDTVSSDGLRKRILAQAHQQCGDEWLAVDVMITVVKVDSDYGIHACKMPSLYVTIENNRVPFVKAISVLVHGSPRPHAHLKHIDWIQDRKILEEYAIKKASQAQIDAFGEVILSTRTHETLLFEGLITNFFVGNTLSKDILTDVVNNIICFSERRQCSHCGG